MVATTPRLTGRAFRAMSTDIELLCPESADADRRLGRAERWLHAFEARFSRFQPLSELSRLNAAGGPFTASPMLIQIVSLSLELARRSGGLFDPTLLRQVEGAGYDRSFDALPARPDRRPVLPSARAWKRVRIGYRRRTITLPLGVGLDLGGIGKGWAVDRMARIVGAPALVNAGGDVYASGCPPEGGPWLVGVQDALRPDRDAAVLAVRDRGVATSSVVRRRWRVGETWAHHIIDPRTGAPSDSDVLTATVVAPTATLADYHAKVALLLGAAKGVRHIERERDVEGLVVLRDGSLRTSRGMDRYLVRPP